MKGYKTILFNVLVAIAPVLDVIVFLGGIPEVGSIIPHEYYPFYAVGVALANKGLRFVRLRPWASLHDWAVATLGADRAGLLGGAVRHLQGGGKSRRRPRPAKTGPATTGQLCYC